MTMTSIITSSQFLKEHETQLDALQVALGFDSMHFEQFVLPVLLSLSAFVQALPFSDTVENTAGGGSRFALRYATRVVQVAQNHFFYPHSKQEQREQIEEEAVFVCFLAALAKIMANVYSYCQLTSETGDFYHPLVAQMSLLRWRECICPKQEIQLYLREKKIMLARAHEAALFSLLVPNGLLTYFNPQVIFDVFARFEKQEHASLLFNDVLEQAFNLTMNHSGLNTLVQNSVPENQNQLALKNASTNAPIIHDDARELLMAINHLVHEKNLQKYCTFSETGVLVKNILLGSVGTSFIQAKTILQDSGLVLQSAGSALLLHPVVKQFLN